MGMKIVNFPVEEGLLAAAHKRAAHEGTTLPAAFHAWLKAYAGHANHIDPEESKRQAERSMKTIREIQKSIKVKDGRKLTREEMNERR